MLNVEQTLVDLIKQVAQLTTQVEMMGKIGWLLITVVVMQIFTNFSLTFKKNKNNKEQSNEQK